MRATNATSAPATVGTAGTAGNATRPAATAEVPRNARDGGSAGDDGDDGVIIESTPFSLRVDREMNLKVSGTAPQLALLRERIEHFNRLERADKQRQLAANAYRYGPYAAIALLPAFALLLMLVYPLRSRRHPQRPRRFAAHLVFTAHNHAFLFVMAVLAALLPRASLTIPLLAVAATAWLLQSLRVVYGGGWPSTLARAFVLLLAYAVLFTLVTLALLAVAVILE